ncbi:unnamed protein product [Calypogeia fissa]
MAGVMAHFPAYDGNTMQGNPPLPVSGLTRPRPATCLYTWIALHILASLVAILASIVPHTLLPHYLKNLLPIQVVVFVDGIILLAFICRSLFSLEIEREILESTIANLRDSPNVASQARYQLRDSATVNNLEERGSNVERDNSSEGEKQLSLEPSKLVAHADPDWMSELQLEPSPSLSNNLKVIEEESAEEQEAGPSSASQKLSGGEDHLKKKLEVPSGYRPFWVEDGTLCVVCRNPFGPEGAHVLGTCGHVFHPPCLVDYSMVKRHCFCGVPIDTRYYASVCLGESMPLEWRDMHGRSSLHGDVSWAIVIDE